MLRRGLFVAAMAASMMAGQAQADTIHVRPGKNAIQKAVNRADPGDRLAVRKGVYREDVEVDKRLTIVGKDRRPPVIDGRCKTDRPIDVLADRVKLSNLKVKGARGSITGHAVDVTGVGSVKLRDLVLRESCGGAYYGINVAGAGPTTITGVRVSGGFVDAGIYVGSIGNLGPRQLFVARNEAFGNNVGILIEDAGPDANIVVRNNSAHGNVHSGPSTPAGILVRRADGGRYVGNRTNRNGEYGIVLVDEGAQPAANVLVDNTAFGNGTAPFLDDGSGSCGSGNSFPIDPC
jgi:hypothetical protein